MPDFLENNPLYKYTGVDGLKRILKDGVRFTQPGAFNDPFELLPELVIRKNHIESNAGISFDIIAPRREPPVGEITDVAEDFISNDFTSRNIVKELNSSIGILCLSKTKDSLLMWSHYSDQYAGALVEFDGNHDFFYGKIDVEYKSNRRKIDLSSYLAGPFPLAEICIKPKEWEYEQEVRIARQLINCTNKNVQDNRGFPIFVKKLPQESIKNVTLGERTTVKDQREIYDLIRNTDIGLDIAAIANSGYEFRREVVKFPGADGRNLSPVISPRTAHIFSHLQNGLGEVARWMIDNHPDSIYVNNLA